MTTEIHLRLKRYFTKKTSKCKLALRNGSTLTRGGVLRTWRINKAVASVIRPKPLTCHLTHVMRATQTGDSRGAHFQDHPQRLDLLLSHLASPCDTFNPISASQRKWWGCQVDWFTHCSLLYKYFRVTAMKPYIFNLPLRFNSLLFHGGHSLHLLE